MYLNKIYNLLKQTGLPVAYHHFTHSVKPPYLAYFEESGEMRGADNKNCIYECDMIIELYTNKIDQNTEKKVTEKINQLNIEYDIDRTWIESEKLYQTVYGFHLIEKRLEE